MAENVDSRSARLCNLLSLAYLKKEMKAATIEIERDQSAITVSEDMLI